MKAEAQHTRPTTRQLALPGWLRWAGAHTLACAALGAVCAQLGPPALISQLLLGALFCLFHGLTIAQQRRDGSVAFLLTLAALPVVAPWLLLAPITFGTPPAGNAGARFFTMASTGAIVGLALLPIPDPDGRQSLRLGASALTWGLTALADGVLGQAMHQASDGALAVAVLSGALSGAAGGLGGGWLAARAWSVTRGGEVARRHLGAYLALGARWLMGCVLIGTVASGVILLPLRLIIDNAYAAWFSALIPLAGMASTLGAGGGMLLAWLRGEGRKASLRRAIWGLWGALFGLPFGIAIAFPFAYGYPTQTALLAGACIGLCAGVGQDGAAPPGRGRTPWWPVAMLLAVSGGGALTAWLSSYQGQAASDALVGLGLHDISFALVAGALAGAVGGLWGLPPLLLAGRQWPFDHWPWGARGNRPAGRRD